MRSSHVDLYNHDEDAATYDRDVLRSEDPIREGYAEVLDWVAQNAGITQDATVVELGSGTGNLTARLPPCRSLVCVDVSAEMSKIAKRKLDGASHISYVQADILEYFDADPPSFDVAISTYVVHHLTQKEKELLLDQLVRWLLPGGCALFGDLMLESAQEERMLVDHYRSIGDNATAAAIEEEFFWYVDASVSYLRDLGLSVEKSRFSTLSWGIKIQMPR